jgi:hypothetical protein
MFGRRKETDLIRTEAVATVVKQLSGLIEWQKEVYGPGIQLAMVQFKFFEDPWVYGYICGWLEGCCLGGNVPQKFWKRTVEDGLREADWFLRDLYKAHKSKIKWLKSMSTKANTEKFQDGMIYGLEEGGVVGKEIKVWLGGGEFPSKENVMFNSLGKSMNLGNMRSVEELFKMSREGDKAAKYLTQDLKENWS